MRCEVFPDAEAPRRERLYVQAEQTLVPNLLRDGVDLFKV
jgi:hypothetical protein